MWWSFGSMLVAMVAALGGAFAERFARTHGWSPDSTEACALAGAFAALVVAALLLFRFRGRSLRLEFTAGVVSLYRGTRVVHADVPVEQLAIVHGSHLVGRGGGTIATLLVSFPAGRTLRIGGSGVAPSEQLRRRSTWLVHPRLAVSALEWPILIERLQRAEVRP